MSPRKVLPYTCIISLDLGVGLRLDLCNLTVVRVRVKFRVEVRVKVWVEVNVWVKAWG